MHRLLRRVLRTRSRWATARWRCRMGHGRHRPQQHDIPHHHDLCPCQLAPNMAIRLDQEPAGSTRLSRASLLPRLRRRLRTMPRRLRTMRRLFPHLVLSCVGPRRRWSRNMGRFRHRNDGAMEHRVLRVRSRQPRPRRPRRPSRHHRRRHPIPSRWPLNRRLLRRQRTRASRTIDTVITSLTTSHRVPVTTTVTIPTMPPHRHMSLVPFRRLSRA